MSVVACRPRGSTSEPPVTEQPVVDGAPVEAPHPNLHGNRLVATLDGSPIYEGDLQERLLLLNPDDSRSDALASLVEQSMVGHMVELLADMGSVEALYERDNPDPLIVNMADQHGMTLDEFRSALVEQGTSWAAIDGFVQSVHGEFAMLRAFGIEPASDDPVERRRRDEVFSCMRMAADVDILDADLTLPDPRFPATFTLDGVDFAAPPDFDLEPLREAYEAAVDEHNPLCMGLLALAPALVINLDNRAYHDAGVAIDWPSPDGSPAVVQVAIDPGPRFTIGEVTVRLADGLGLTPAETEATVHRVRAAFVAHRDVGQHAELPAMYAGTEAATNALLDHHPDLSLDFEVGRSAPTAFTVVLIVTRR
ncbi:MAG: hypothetical protein AAF721_08010 [Myxococcota bacterium]